MAKVQAKSEVSGSVWKIEVAVGQSVAVGDILMLIESMKMEIPVVVEGSGGKVASLLVAEGEAIVEGQTVATLDT